MEKPKEVKKDDIGYEKILDLFPKYQSDENLRITDVGLYSITKKNEAYFITNLILKYFGEEKITVTDSTACCGGNTISFSLNNQFEKVNSIELDELHFEILKHNVSIYQKENKVNFFNNNFLVVGKTLKQDVIFYDLPWGGRGYNEVPSLNLSLNDENGNPVDISTIVNMFKEKCKLQVLKLPINFNFTSFLQEITYAKIKIHKIYNKYNKKLCYYILILIN